MQITNPFNDENFSEFQLKSGKASKVHEIEGSFVYQFPIRGKYCMFYTSKWTNKIHESAKKENAIYTLVENYEKSVGKPPYKNRIPRHTIVIDLNQSEEEILQGMHQKGRYNIKLARKKCVEIRKSTNTDEFYKILQETGSRDGFHLNPPEFYQTMLGELKDKVALYMAYYNDQPIAGIIVTFIGNTATYFYGASSNEHRNLMAPYLLQWHAIQEAKKREYQYYDFLGIADPKNPKDPLKGVTEFKRKFGGQHIEWPRGGMIIHKPFLNLLLKLKNSLKL